MPGAVPATHPGMPPIRGNPTGARRCSPSPARAGEGGVREGTDCRGRCLHRRKFVRGAAGANPRIRCGWRQEVRAALVGCAAAARAGPRNHGALRGRHLRRRSGGRVPVAVSRARTPAVLPGTWRSPLPACALAGGVARRRGEKVREATVKTNRNDFQAELFHLPAGWPRGAACEGPGADGLDDAKVARSLGGGAKSRRAEGLHGRLPDAHDLPGTEAIAWMDALMRHPRHREHRRARGGPPVRRDQRRPRTNRRCGASRVPVAGQPAQRPAPDEGPACGDAPGLAHRHGAGDRDAGRRPAVGATAARWRPWNALMASGCARRAACARRRPANGHRLRRAPGPRPDRLDARRRLLANRDRPYTAPVGPQYWSPPAAPPPAPRPVRALLRQTRPRPWPGQQLPARGAPRLLGAARLAPVPGGRAGAEHRRQPDRRAERHRPLLGGRQRHRPARPATG